jgi:hypothetical protein
VRRLDAVPFRARSGMAAAGPAGRVRQEFEVRRLEPGSAGTIEGTLLQFVENPWSASVTKKGCHVAMRTRRRAGATAVGRRRTVSPSGELCGHGDCRTANCSPMCPIRPHRRASHHNVLPMNNTSKLPHYRPARTLSRGAWRPLLPEPGEATIIYDASPFSKSLGSAATPILSYQTV